MNDIFFTADTHFFHKRIITDFELRPFKDVDEMNEALVDNWNKLVTKSDRIYILGDFSFGNTEDSINICKRLKGQKYLILGNHDTSKWFKRSGMFQTIDQIRKVKVDDMRFILCHFPIYTWEGKEKGYIHLHGHTHNQSHTDFEDPRKINVGVDLWDYKPVSIEQIKEKIKEKLQ